MFRKGVGKAMLTKVMEEARKRDIHNVYTFIRVDNKVGAVREAQGGQLRIRNTVRRDSIWAESSV